MEKYFRTDFDLMEGGEKVDTGSHWTPSFADGIYNSEAVHRAIRDYFEDEELTPINFTYIEITLEEYEAACRR